MAVCITDTNPFLWSVVEATALADAEVEYADHKSNTILCKIFNSRKCFKDLRMLKL